MNSASFGKAKTHWHPLLNLEILIGNGAHRVGAGWSWIRSLLNQCSRRFCFKTFSTKNNYEIGEILLKWEGKREEFFELREMKMTHERVPLQGTKSENLSERMITMNEQCVFIPIWSGDTACWTIVQQKSASGFVYCNTTFRFEWRAEGWWFLSGKLFVLE